MRSPNILGLYLACLALSGCAAAQINKSSSPAPAITPPLLFGAPETAHLTGEAPTIDLLVRGFVPRGKTLDPTFGHFTYLYFDANSDSTKASRLQASKAFMQLFRNVEDEQALHIAHEKLAVLVAPIVGDRAPMSGDELISVYDYSYAQLISERARRSREYLPSVALISSETPLNTFAQGDEGALTIVDLCGDSRDVERKILAFRNALTLDKSVLSTGGFDLLGKVRGFLGALGAFALTPLTSTQAPPVSTCR